MSQFVNKMGKCNSRYAHLHRDLMPTVESPEPCDEINGIRLWLISYYIRWFSLTGRWTFRVNPLALVFILIVSPKVSD